MPIQHVDPSMPRAFPRTTYANPPPAVERQHLRISPTAMFYGSPEDVEASRLYRLRHPWPSDTGEIFIPYRVNHWNDVYCPDDHKRATSSRVNAFRQFEATLPQAPIRTSTLLHNGSTSIHLPPLSSPTPGSQIPNDDEVPDLLDPDESGDESLTSLTTFFPEITSASIQPVDDVSGFSPQLHEVPTERHFPNELQSSANPQSSNLILTQFNQQEFNQATSASVPRMSSDTPERNFERQARRCLARHTVDIQRRLYMADAPLATLPPFDECRVRRWLRQLYPYEFRAFLAVQITPEVSLELAEVRALLRALILKNINIKWFRDKLFTRPLLEHLAILLRNQHDRFLLDFYHQGNIDIPRTQDINRHVWRTVLCHVAFSNQRFDDMWRVDFHESTLHDGQPTQDNEHLDNVVSKLLEGYDGSPFVPVPSTPIYRTLDISNLFFFFLLLVKLQ